MRFDGLALEWATSNLLTSRGPFSTTKGEDVSFFLLLMILMVGKVFYSAVIYDIFLAFVYFFSLALR